MVWQGCRIEEEKLPTWDYVTQSLLVIVMMEITSEASEKSCALAIDCVVLLKRPFYPFMYIYSLIGSFIYSFNIYSFIPRYVCSATSGVSDAINLYNMAFDGDGAYAPPPLPHYLVDQEDSLDALDTCFLLLQLFQDKSSVKLERLLAPISHTHLPLDSRVRSVY